MRKRQPVSGRPAARVLGEHGRSIVLRVHRHREQQQTLTQPIAKLALQHGEICREPRADVGQRAPRVDEVDRHDLAAKIGGAQSAALLVGELEIRQRRTDGELFRGRGKLRIRRAGRPDIPRNRPVLGYRKLERDARARMQRCQFGGIFRVERHQHRGHVVPDRTMRHQHRSRTRVHRDHDSIHGICLREHREWKGLRRR